MILFYKKVVVFKLITLILLLQSFSGFFNADIGLFAQINQTCEENLEKADDAYYDSEFDEALRLIGLCLNQSDISNIHRSLAYTVFARTLMAMGESEKAKDYIGKILEINPDYEPTIEEETPKYVNMVSLVRKKIEQQKQIEEESGISSWVWIGAGGVVAAVTVIALISSGEEEKKDDPLPEPPEFP